jgi:hypothetical protein
VFFRLGNVPPHTLHLYMALLDHVRGYSVYGAQAKAVGIDVLNCGLLCGTLLAEGFGFGKLLHQFGITSCMSCNASLYVFLIVVVRFGLAYVSG